MEPADLPAAAAAGCAAECIGGRRRKPLPRYRCRPPPLHSRDRCRRTPYQEVVLVVLASRRHPAPRTHSRPPSGPSSGPSAGPPPHQRLRSCPALLLFFSLNFLNVSHILASNVAVAATDDGHCAVIS